MSIIGELCGNTIENCRQLKNSLTRAVFVSNVDLLYVGHIIFIMKYGVSTIILVVLRPSVKVEPKDYSMFPVGVIISL